MSQIINPQNCKRWQYADRSTFEMGDLYELAEDIKRNGQIEPAIARPIKNDKDGCLYEIIAGSRRWQACLQHNLPLKVDVRELTDQEAMVVQVKENDKEKICDYSKGMFFAALLDDKKTTMATLCEKAGITRRQLHRYLAFHKVQADIWTAVKNMSKVSVRAAETIFQLSKRGPEYVNALMEISEDIRKGAGSRKIIKLVFDILDIQDDEIDTTSYISLNDGTKIAEWTKTGIKFQDNIPFNQNELTQNLVQFFEQQEKKAGMA